MKKVEKSNPTYKLTQEQREFLADFSYLAKKWKRARLAALFGVSRQNADYLAKKREKEEKEAKCKK